MEQFWVNILVLVFSSTTLLGSPIKDGKDVGHIKIIDGHSFISGATDFPYIVFITITSQTERSYCAGVIIGKNAVLTAGHCLYGTVQPAATIHAGIIERILEANRGQILKMIDYKVHERYKRTCNIGKKRCCYDANDLAIIWTNKEFVPAPQVQRAVLNAKIEKPVGKEGWILGWGEKNTNKMAAMLQKGLVKVISQEQCQQHNPDIYITQNLICLQGVKRSTKSSFGDSGGPLVIDGKVYGISSIGIPRKNCPANALDGYTFVAQYFDWINKQLRAGPQKNRNSAKPKKSN